MTDHLVVQIDAAPGQTFLAPVGLSTPHAVNVPRRQRDGALGYRVSPQEVEEALASHPGVAEVAVAELPIRADLSLVAAFVVPEGEMPGEDILTAHAEARLAPYKRPRLWIAVDALPRTANGKLIRKRLVAEHRRDAAENAAENAVSTPPDRTP
ncbi:MAG: hypothetical protein AAF844_12590 [Pseudomonadota bacterium]